MMNELFILGELMEGGHTGYDLRNTLQLSLGPYRKISFGVLYPLLNRLEASGYISLTADEGKRNKKMACITEKGKQRFFELMAEEVPKGARKDDLYAIKLDVMQHLPLEKQIALLETYRNDQQAVRDYYSDITAELAKKKSQDHAYAARKFKLRLEQTKLALKWTEDFIRDLKNETIQTSDR